MLRKLTVYKIGGNLMDEPLLLDQALRLIANDKGKKILVHGGGRQASDLSRRLQVDVKMINGRRITDSDALDVAAMVFAGLLNKQIVARLISFGCTSIGLSGTDANIILAHKRPVKDIDYGYVGDIDMIDKEALESFFEQGWCPVISPITHDGQGQLLNTNADTIAATIAEVFAGEYLVKLIFLLEIDGILRNPADHTSVISKLDQEGVILLKENGTIGSGMIPKVDNAMFALVKGVSQVVIGSPKSVEEGKATAVIL